MWRQLLECVDRIFKYLGISKNYKVYPKNKVLKESTSHKTSPLNQRKLAHQFFFLMLLSDFYLPMVNSNFGRYVIFKN